MRRLFLDLDGVLADYDSRANEVLETDNHFRYDFIHGRDAYWRLINERCPHNFFLGMRRMPDAKMLWDACNRDHDPAILTALPEMNSESVNRQKRLWIQQNFGDHVPVITCGTLDKPNYCNVGDVLVDDRTVNRDAWLSKGGLFITHVNAAETIEQLIYLGVIQQ
jgi:hypothetical protein